MDQNGRSVFALKTNLSDGVLHVVRFRKIFPAVLIYFNAVLLTGKRMDWGASAFSLTFLVVVSMLGMKLNVLTDRELDTQTKPELYAALVVDSMSLQTWVAIELLAAATCLAALTASGRYATAIALAVFGIMFNLYSFNFFVPGGAKQYRLKIFWWGNAVSVCAAYFTIWIAGVSVTGFSLTAARASGLLQMIGLCVLFEYCLFLDECATDADAERAAGLKTLPALFGRSGTAFAAVLLWGLTGVICGLCRVKASSDTSSVARFSEMVVWYGAVTGLTSLLFLALSTLRHIPRQWDRTADVAFWVLRVVPFVVLLWSAALGTIGSAP